MLGKLAASSPGEVLAQLENLAEPLEKTLTMRLKSDSVKQEVGRAAGGGGLTGNAIGERKGVGYVCAWQHVRTRQGFLP